MRVIALLLVFAALFSAQSLFGPFAVSIQINDGTGAGITLPTNLSELLEMQPGSLGSGILKEQTCGDPLTGIINSAGFRGWTYSYPSFTKAVVKFVSLATSARGGSPMGFKTTTLQLTQLPDGTLNGSYAATLADGSGNTLYQVSGTVTAAPITLVLAVGGRPPSFE